MKLLKTLALGIALTSSFAFAKTVLLSPGESIDLNEIPTEFKNVQSQSEDSSKPRCQILRQNAQFEVYLGNKFWEGKETFEDAMSIISKLRHNKLCR